MTRILAYCCTLVLLCCRADDVPVSKFIVGGSPVAIGEFDFYGTPPPGVLCGHSLIWPDILLSAAHCQGLYVNYEASIGGILPNRTDAIDSIRAVEERIHPRYTSYNLDNDVMLIKLERPSDIPVATWNTDDSYPSDGDELTVIGFGRTAYGGSRSELLLKVNVPMVEDCSDTQPGLTENQMCAGGEEGKDSCQGDSGSPLMDSNNVIVGLVSFGNGGGCGEPGKPGGYARVSKANQFIIQGICELSANPPLTGCDAFTRVPTKAPTTNPPTPPPPTPGPTVTPPFNDACLDAWTLEASGSRRASFDTATPDDGLPLCGRGVASSEDLPGVWFHISGFGAVQEAYVCDVESEIYVFDGSGCGSLVCIAGKADGCENGIGSVARWPTVFGRDYWLLVRTPLSTQTSFEIKTVPALTPRNTVCDRAMEVSNAVTGSTINGLTRPFGVPSCSDESYGRSLWYKVIGTGNQMEASTCSDITDYESRINIFRNSCDALACVDLEETSCDFKAIVRWQSVVNEEYYVLVHGPEMGIFRLDVHDTNGDPSTDTPTTTHVPTNTPTDPPTDHPTNDDPDTPNDENGCDNFFCILFKTIVDIFECLF